MAAQANQIIECGVCAEDISGTSYPAGTDRVCADCAKENIIPLLLDSLKYETRYPAMWGGGEALDHHAYADLLPADFAVQLEAKANEYSIPGASRLYCRNVCSGNPKNTEGALMPSQIRILRAHDWPVRTCDAFLGAKTAGKENTQCKTCRGWTCTRCGEPGQQKIPGKCEDLSLIHI